MSAVQAYAEIVLCSATTGLAALNDQGGTSIHLQDPHDLELRHTSVQYSPSHCTICNQYYQLLHLVWQSPHSGRRPELPQSTRVVINMCGLYTKWRVCGC